MKINEMQLYSALTEYIDREIMPLTASMDLTKQFMFGLKVGVVKRRIENVVRSYLRSAEMSVLDIVDDNGNIDIEPIYQSAMDMMAKMQKLELGGISFTQADLQKLYSIMQRYTA